MTRYRDPVGTPSGTPTRGPSSSPPISAQPITTMFEGVEIESTQSADSPPSLAALVAEDRRVFGRTAPADFDALRRACQQGPDVMPLKRYYDGEALSTAPEWRGTRVEIIAFPLTPDNRAGNETLRVPLGHPWAYWEFPNIDGPCIVARWCHRYPGRPGVLEVAWDGRRLFATQTRRSVHFLGGDGSIADAARLMNLWIATTEAALRPRTRRRDRDLDLAQAVLAAVTLMGQEFHQPTREEVWAAVADSEMVQPATIRERWKRADPRISIRDVLLLAKERVPLLPLSDSERTP